MSGRTPGNDEPNDAWLSQTVADPSRNLPDTLRLLLAWLTEKLPFVASSRASTQSSREGGNPRFHPHFAPMRVSQA